MINGMKIGLSTASDIEFLKPEVLASVKEAGIEVIEMSYNPVEKMTNIGIVNFAKIVKEAGLELWSVHIPFTRIDLASPIEEERKRDVEIVKGFIDDIAEAGVGRAVIHPGFEVKYDSPREVRIDACRRSFYEVTEYGLRKGVTVCIEDLPRDCIGNTISEMKEIVSCHPDLKIVFDTNHLLQDDPIEFIKVFGDRIVTLHVSDYEFTDERHWMPGEGKNDWNGIINALREAGYKGPWLYELGRVPQRGIIRERDLTFRDFYENAEALLNGRAPKVLGRYNG